jgi:hypothetical protein
VETSEKGHSQEAVQVALLQQLAAHVPFPGPVLFRGDSEFDGVELQRQLRTLGWFYVLRTSPNLFVYPEHGDGFALGELAPAAGCPLQSRFNLSFTTKHRFAPVNLFACWQAPYDEPLLLYHLPPAWPTSAHTLYEHRFATEPLFGDCKDAGFRLTQTQLEHPDRLARLFLALSAAYLWMFCLGVQVIRNQAADLVDRSKRRTLSLFKTGWRWFKCQLKLGRFVPFHLFLPLSFALPPLKFTDTCVG